MRKVLTLLIINLLVFSSYLSAQDAVVQTITFNTNHYELTDEAKSVLDEAYATIKGREVLQVKLSGYTDATGSTNYNLALSAKRAEATLKYLLHKGVSKDKVVLEFYGENRPVALNSNKQGKQQNRRVEIVINSREKKLTNVFSLFDNGSQTFRVLANDDIQIKGKEGTVVDIRKGSLVNDTGEAAEGEIEIKLKEFYTKADIISANLHTMSDNNLLETGGMIYIAATQAGKELNLKEAEKIQIEFATNANKGGMQIFLGKNGEESFNWVLERDSIHIYTEEITVGANLRTSDYKSYESNPATAKEVAQTDNIILKSGQLGWINCDRFYDVKNKTDLLVKVDPKYGPIVRLIFKDINSVMPADITEQQDFIFHDVPVGYKATLVAFGILDDVLYSVSKSIVINKKQEENLILVKTTIDELKNELKTLNK